MAISNLITNAVADTYNALSSGWLALADITKTRHIFNASAYIQARWSCVDVDWDDETTIDNDILRACAYYADADRVGVLFPAVAVVEPHRAITVEKKKLGSMEKTLQWADAGGLTTGNPLASIDAIMSLYCTRIGIGSGVLTRV